MSVTIAKLVKRARLGDEEAFRALRDAYLGLIWRVAFSITHDRNDVEEIVQETTIRAWRGLPDFKGGRFKIWIMRIATHCASDVGRRRELEERTRVVWWGGEDGLVDAEGERRVWSREIRPRLRKAVAALTPAEKAATYLRFIERASAAEIGEALGIDAAAARMTVYRATSKLRAFLKGLVR